MEILFTLSNKNDLTKARQFGADGIIFGGPFSGRYDYTASELEEINNYCWDHNLKRYISIDAFIYEEDRGPLYEYLEYIKSFNVDGIYFTDLGVINAAKRRDLSDRLIYDPDTLLTNSLDIAFYLKQGIGTVLARELTLKEVLDIVKKNVDQLDMQVFGHLKMSNSRRKFISNYFKHMGILRNVEGKKTIRLLEESRSYRLPVIEDEHGTRIYTDYCLLMYKELAYLKHVLRRVIVDDAFLSDPNAAFDMIRDIRRLTPKNMAFLEDAFLVRYPHETFSSGYLHQKTVKKKETDE